MCSEQRLAQMNKEGLDDPKFHRDGPKASILRNYVITIPSFLLVVGKTAVTQQRVLIMNEFKRYHRMGWKLACC